VIGEWEAMKRYIVERAREDATAGPNPTLRTLAQHVLRAVDEPPVSGAALMDALVDVLRPALAVDAAKPHEFKGRPDRWCDLCNRPDRHPIHAVTVPRA
jgi:hypothetical protein